MRLDLRTRTLTSAQGSGEPMDDAAEIADPITGRANEPRPLDALKALTKIARSQQREVETKLRAARAWLDALLAQQKRHSKSLVKLFSTLPPDLDHQISRIEAEITALEAWEEASCVHITFEPADIVDSAYGEIMRAFDCLRTSWGRWDVSAGTSVTREHPPVSLEFRNGNAVAFDGKALKFEAGDKSAVIIYPAMVMTIDADSIRDLFDLRDLRVDATLIHVAEDDIIPPDAHILRSSPSHMSVRTDVSLHHDHRLPICVYGRLTLRGPRGILGEYQFSNAKAAEMFAEAFRRFRDEVYGDGDPAD